MSFRSRGNRNAEGRSVTACRDSSLSGADGRRTLPQFWFGLEVTIAAECRAIPEKSQNRPATGWESVSNGDQLAYPEQRKRISGDVEGCACSGSHGRGRRFETCSAHHESPGQRQDVTTTRTDAPESSRGDHAGDDPVGLARSA
jgi:hypothetical protein